METTELTTWTSGLGRTGVGKHVGQRGRGTRVEGEVFPRMGEKPMLIESRIPDTEGKNRRDTPPRRGDMLSWTRAPRAARSEWELERDIWVERLDTARKHGGLELVGESFQAYQTTQDLPRGSWGSSVSKTINERKGVVTSECLPCWRDRMISVWIHRWWLFSQQ